MKKNIRLHQADIGKRKIRTHIVAVSIAAVLVLLVLFCFLVLPRLTARAAFGDALERLDRAYRAEGGSVVLCDPYVPTDLYPETRSVTLRDEEARALSERLLLVFSSYRYEETDVKLAGGLLPYVCVKGGGATVYFYLESDSVWVEKDSTYYRFSPAKTDGETAYAELYQYVSETLSEAPSA